MSSFFNWTTPKRIDPMLEFKTRLQLIEDMITQLILPDIFLNILSAGLVGTTSNQAGRPAWETPEGRKQILLQYKHILGRLDILVPILIYPISNQLQKSGVEIKTDLLGMANTKIMESSMDPRGAYIPPHTLSPEILLEEWIADRKRSMNPKQKLRHGSSLTALQRTTSGPTPPPSRDSSPVRTGGYKKKSRKNRNRNRNQNRKRTNKRVTYGRKTSQRKINRRRSRRSRKQRS